MSFGKKSLVPKIPEVTRGKKDRRFNSHFQVEFKSIYRILKNGLLQ